MTRCDDFYNNVLVDLIEGSVTKISTIPNSSLFLTGSKDGDVKLWDAKTTKLVFHWPKLHERHTFLQPSSRSFGGVVRVMHLLRNLIFKFYHIFLFWWYIVLV